MSYEHEGDEFTKPLYDSPQVDWKEKFEKEQQACNHWFKEANESHNEACKIADEFREFKEKHQQRQLTEEEMVRIVFDKLEPETRDSLEIQHIALIAQSITRAIISRQTGNQ